MSAELAKKLLVGGGNRPGNGYVPVVWPRPHLAREHAPERHEERRQP